MVESDVVVESDVMVESEVVVESDVVVESEVVVESDVVVESSLHSSILGSGGPLTPVQFLYDDFRRSHVLLASPHTQYSQPRTCTTTS
jgi:UDP-3-O-[3-hydroxymyristoyl] glucosamine N-acyltransferase